MKTIKFLRKEFLVLFVFVQKKKCIGFDEIFVSVCHHKRMLYHFITSNAFSNRSLMVKWMCLDFINDFTASFSSSSFFFFFSFFLLLIFFMWVILITFQQFPKNSNYTVEWVPFYNLSCSMSFI